jgi:hypothetical protein
VEVDAHKYGFVASLGLIPRSTRALLRMAPTRMKYDKKIHRSFDEYCAYEPRTLARRRRHGYQARE